MEQKLHVGMPFEESLENKKIILEKKRSLLELIEKLTILKQIRSQKITIYGMLHTAQKNFVELQTKLKKELPTIRGERKEKTQQQIKQIAEKTNPSLEEELKSIQEKLKQLNTLS
jgi:IS30 family transposase